MNYLVAKIKHRGCGFMKVMSLEDSIFEIPDVSEQKQYVASYKLEDDEWFKLDNFSSLNYKNDLIDRAFNSTDFNQITKEKYFEIEYLCCKQDEIFLFQKMSSVQILSKKWFQISEEPTLNVNLPIIVLNNKIDAIYDKNINRLYFKDIARIKVMFEGIEELYREATKDEIEIFLQQDFIALVDGFSANDVKTANRKRIAQVMDVLNQFTSLDKKQICEYIQKYCEDVPVDNNTFQINSENRLKKILYGIEQRYYTTVLGNEKRLANSVIAI